MIEQRNISVISNKTVKMDGHRILEEIIERDYCMAWLLVGLSNSHIKNKLAFKGGTALRRCYFANYRFSEDLDFTLIEALSLDDLLKAFGAIFELVKDEVGLTFNIGKIEPSSKNTHTFYIEYNGPLPPKNILSSIKEVALRKELGI